MPNLSHQWESVSLKEAYARNLPAQAERLKRFKSEFGSTVIGEVTVEQALGGMRGVTGLVWEGSVLDPEEGIKFRGLTIDEVRVSLGVAGEREPQPEALFWLLLTGQIPNEDQVAQLSRELAARGELPGHVETLLDTLPRDLHPMAQLSIAVTALEGESHFARAYLAGVPRGELWEHTYEDALNLIAKLPAIAGRIYHNVFGGGQGTQGAFVLDPQADYSENLCRALGVQPDGETEDFHNLMRLYLTIHADHEGGNDAPGGQRAVVALPELRRRPGRACGSPARPREPGSAGVAAGVEGRAGARGQDRDGPRGHPPVPVENTKLREGGPWVRPRCAQEDGPQVPGTARVRAHAVPGGRAVPAGLDGLRGGPAGAQGARQDAQPIP